MDQLYKVWLKQAKQKARIEELEEQVQLLKTDKEEMFSLYVFSSWNCSSNSSILAFYLAYFSRALYN